MKRHALSLLIVMPLVGLVVTACGQQQSAQEAQAHVASSISVTSITPQREDTLRVGDVVALHVELSYVLGSPAGNVGLVVQTGDGQVLAEQVAPVGSGGREMALQAAFTVPETDFVHVVVPISERGRSTTSDVEIVTYEVVAR